MASVKEARPASQITDNPQVIMRYEPEKALLVLGHDALEVLGQLQGAKITNLKTFEAASETLHDGELALQRIVETRDLFATRVREAFEPFKRLPVFAGATINITLTMPVRQKIEDAVKTLKRSRAQFQADEQDRLRREQLQKDADQRKINEENAKIAAANAKKAGADKETIAEIKEEVLATPAPLVESKVAQVAQSVGASLRFNYKAEITDLRAFLTYALTNDVLFNTLGGAVGDIEDAFDKMAQAQKESFKYPGITYKKIPVDVSRRSF